MPRSAGGRDNEDAGRESQESRTGGGNRIDATTKRRSASMARHAQKKTRRRGLGVLVYASVAGRHQRPDTRSCRPPAGDPQAANFRAGFTGRERADGAKQAVLSGGLRPAARWLGKPARPLWHGHSCWRQHAGLPAFRRSLEHLAEQHHLPDRLWVAQHRGKVGSGDHCCWRICGLLSPGLFGMLVMLVMLGT